MIPEGVAGITEAAIVIGYKGEKIKSYFGKEFKGMLLRYVKQRVAMGTAHALLKAKSAVKGEKKFLCTYADVIVSAALWKRLMKEGNKFDAVVAVTKEKDATRYGRVFVDGKNVKQIIEKPRQGKKGSSLVNRGCYCFSQRIFKALHETKISRRGEFELTNSINKLIESKGKVGYVLHTGKFFDVGSRTDLRKAEGYLKGKNQR